jgi:hypothetical protein
MPEIYRNSLGEYNKSCIASHQESNKIEFAFFLVFYDFLEILQVSSNPHIQDYTKDPKKNWGLAIRHLAVGGGAANRNSGEASGALGRRRVGLD